MRKKSIIYNKYLHNLGGGEVVTFDFAQSLVDLDYDVEIISEKSVSEQTFFNRLGFNMNLIKMRTIKPNELNTISNKYNCDLFINVTQGEYIKGIGKNNIYYIHFPVNPLLFENTSSKIRKRLYKFIIQNLETYQTVLTNSEFTKGWIKRYWNVDADVLYPGVKLLNPTEIIFKSKQNWISSVGRFYPNSHNKQHEFMIRSFIKLITFANQKTQLHLIGGLTKEIQNKKYFLKLQKISQGFPIFFHTNISRKTLEQILFKSKLYWHATGYSASSTHQTFKFEHFGIAPIEAISAGCIPFLYKGGGLVEIVKLLNLEKTCLFSNKNTLLTNTIELLKQNTYSYLTYSKRRKLIQKYFSYSTFFKKINSYI